MNKIRLENININESGKQKKNMLFNYIPIGIVILGAVFMLIPFSWMLSTSLRLPTDSFKLPPSIFPTKFNYQNYIDVWKSSIPFGQTFINSFKITTIVIIGQLFTCTTAAYAFARLRFPGRNFLFGLLLVSMMIPTQATLIPTYIGMSKLGLIDNHLALILPALINAFGVFLLRQFFMTLPKELEQAGKIDGAGYWTIFFKIALPQAGAAVTALIILTFNSVWNSYFLPLVYINSWDKMTVPLAVASLRGYLASGILSQIMAAVTMAVLPILIVFLFGQRYIIEGLTTSGIKG